MSVECAICCSAYTKLLRKPIECNNCKFTACMNCNKHYILTTNSEVKCMNCNVGWSMNFLFENFSHKFCMEYRRHRQEILWNKELYRIPLVSEYVEYEKKSLQIQLEIPLIEDQIRQQKNNYRNLKGKRSKEISEQRKEIRKEQKRLNELLFMKKKQKWTSIYRKDTIKANFFSGKKTTSQQKNRPCITENCRGFVNSNGQCPICDRVVCLKCNVLKVGDDHSCKQEDIDTFTELEKNTKPCPKCHVRIHKLSGCDQMWCVNCNTAFSWSKGVIEQGRIHNPHYFDWLFRGGGQVDQQVQDINECNEDQLPSPYYLQNFCSDKMDWEKAILKDSYQKLVHLIEVDMRKYEIGQNNVQQHVFRKLYSHINGNENASKNFESYIMKQSIYTELVTLLTNYKRQQIHLFRSILSNQENMTVTEFREKYMHTIAIYKDVLKNFNKFCKKTFKIEL